MKFSRFSFACFLSLYCLQLQAQKTAYEFGFISDNDLYVSFFLDKYYTNGLELFFNVASTSKLRNFPKRVRTLRAGQKMYNPYSYDVPEIYKQDRPYAGYVYASYLETFANPKQLISFGLEAGYTGANTKAREAQKFVHQFYNIQESNGWDHQVDQTIALGIKANFTQNLYYHPEKNIQLAFVNKALVHSILSNVSSGVGLKINLDAQASLSGIDKSLFYNTATHHGQERWSRECFLGIKSLATYQFKDKTVTGDLVGDFTNPNFHLTPWVWHNDIGFYWSLKHWNISYHQIFHTANVQNLKSDWVRYGSIYLSYKF